MDVLESFEYLYYKLFHKLARACGLNIFNLKQIDPHAYFFNLVIISYFLTSIYTIVVYDYVTKLQCISCIGFSVQVGLIND